MLARAEVVARCAWQPTVDRHFDRRIRPDEESGLRAHLPHCPLCRHRYDRQLLLADLLPRQREDAANRLATGLGLTAVRAPTEEQTMLRWPLSDWRWVVAGMALGLGAVTLALSSADRATGGGPAHAQQLTAATGQRSGELAPRSADLLANVLGIFRHGPEGLVELAGGAVAGGERVVFAVRNDRWRYLTIAGLDDAGAVHLLSPTRAIPRAPGLQLLPERRLPAIAGARVRVVAVLTDRPLSDGDLDRALRETLPAADGVRVEMAVVLRPGRSVP